MNRKKSRELAFTVIYQFDFENFSDVSIDYTLNELKQNIIQEENKSNSSNPEKSDEFCKKIISGVKNNLEIIDRLISDTLINWKIERLSTTDKTLLRMGIFEIALVPDIEKNVTISEVIKLSKIYSEADSYKFLNGILDRFEKSGNLETCLKEKK
jgi:N utilization substance protein B